jgi:hypothetical protein
MSPTEAQKQLIDLLVTSNFDTSYYGFYEATKAEAVPPGIVDSDVFGLIDKLPVQFKFNAKEKFFHYRASEAPELGLNLALTPQSAEFILVFKPGSQHIGRQFFVLARDAARHRKGEPYFNYDPPSPRLKFGTEAGLRRALDFGLSLFTEIERRIRLTDKWC